MARTVHPALFASPEGGAIRCGLCRHRCLLRPGATGLCHVRENADGTLVTRSYDDVIALAVDPVEKKPLYHVLPGEQAFSFATRGCNFTCAWCQNHSISQPAQDAGRIGESVSPEEIVAQALVTGCRVVAATYTEPTIFYELALEVGKKAAEEGLVNVWVTNGSITPEALEGIAPFLAAANVDLKGFDDSISRRYTGMAASEVMDSITRMHDLGIWVEVTTLIVPGVNDSVEELTRMAGFIAELDRDIPWHLSRYFPQYRHTAPQTPEATMYQALRVAQEAGLRYVYPGNIHLPGAQNTHCPSCETVLIRRQGNRTSANHLTEDHACPTCGAPLRGIF